jgi:translation initiation factor IF-2
MNDKGERLSSAEPSDIVQISGMDKIPVAGSLFQVGENRNALKVLAETRAKLKKEEAAAKFDKTINQAAKAMQVEVKRRKIKIKEKGWRWWWCFMYIYIKASDGWLGMFKWNFSV